MKRVAFKHIIPLFTAIAAAFFIYKALLNTSFIKKSVRLEIELQSMQASEIQFFLEDDDLFKQENMRSATIESARENKIVSFNIPVVAHAGRLRIDPGFTRGKWLIKRISFKGLYANIDFTPQEIFEKFKPGSDIKEYRLDKDGVFVESSGPDPSFISKFGLKRYGSILTIAPSIYELPLIFCLCIGFFVYYLTRKKLLVYIDREVTQTQVFVVLFIAIVFLPFARMTLYGSETKTGENRSMTPQPVFSFDKVLEYPAAFTAYFDDNFGFRKHLSTFNSYYKLKLFHASSKPNLVVVGKNSWLYSVDPSIVGDYQNQKFYTDEELATIRSNLEEMNEWYVSKGINFHVLMLPIKSNIYPENLPDRLKRKNDRSKMLQLRDYLEAQQSKVKIIDVTDELIKAKESQEVYYQHDVHLNFQGGYIAYEKLIGEMKKKNKSVRPISPHRYIKILRHVHNADLSRILSLEDILLNDEWQLQIIGKEGFKVIDPPVYGTVSLLQPTIRTQVKNEKLPRVVVYRDSFFTLLMPYFSENFRDCIYLWTSEMSEEVAMKEHPDFVVYEMLESGIDKLLQDNPVWMKKQ